MKQSYVYNRKLYRQRMMKREKNKQGLEVNKNVFNIKLTILLFYGFRFTFTPP